MKTRHKKMSDKTAEALDCLEKAVNEEVIRKRFPQFTLEEKEEKDAKEELDEYVTLCSRVLRIFSRLVRLCF